MRDKAPVHVLAVKTTQISHHSYLHDVDLSPLVFALHQYLRSPNPSPFWLPRENRETWLIHQHPFLNIALIDLALH